MSILLQFMVTGSIGIATVTSSTEHRKAGLVRIEQTLLLARSDEKATFWFRTIHEPYFMLGTSGLNAKQDRNTKNDHQISKY